MRTEWVPGKRDASQENKVLREHRLHMYDTAAPHGVGAELPSSCPGGNICIIPTMVQLLLTICQHHIIYVLLLLCLDPLVLLSSTAELIFMSGSRFCISYFLPLRPPARFHLLEVLGRLFLYSPFKQFLNRRRKKGLGGDVGAEWGEVDACRTLCRESKAPDLRLFQQVFWLLAGARYDLKAAAQRGPPCNKEASILTLN